MKHLFLFAVLCSCLLQGKSQMAYAETSSKHVSFFSAVDKNNNDAPDKVLQLGSSGRMSAAAFKNQDYCRAELENFDFDFTFKVVSAKVYFTGANFHGTEIGAITSNSLMPIKELMKRCIPGSIVYFDEVKVLGPYSKIRTIPGATYILY